MESPERGMSEGRGRTASRGQLALRGSNGRGLIEKDINQPHLCRDNLN